MCQSIAQGLICKFELQLELNVNLMLIFASIVQSPTLDSFIFLSLLHSLNISQECESVLEVEVLKDFSYFSLWKLA